MQKYVVKHEQQDTLQMKVVGTKRTETSRSPDDPTPRVQIINRKSMEKGGKKFKINNFSTAAGPRNSDERGILRQEYDTIDHITQLKSKIEENRASTAYQQVSALGKSPNQFIDGSLLKYELQSMHQKEALMESQESSMIQN